MKIFIFFLYPQGTLHNLYISGEHLLKKKEAFAPFPRGVGQKQMGENNFGRRRRTYFRIRPSSLTRNVRIQW